MSSWSQSSTEFILIGEQTSLQSVVGRQLNLGCGKDTWGDVRVDIDRKGTANVIADVHYLPFVDDSFGIIRCWHVLEHCREPQKAAREAKRVGRIVNARFPYRFDRVPWVLSWLSTLNPSGLRGGLQQIWLDLLTKTAERGHPQRHLWMIQPFGRTKLNRLPILSFFVHGRKARLTRKLTLSIPAEWECWF